MTTKLSSLLLMMISAAILSFAGCGGGGGAGSINSSTPTVSFNGVAIDGILKSARAFLDLNDNGTYEDGEPTAITDGNGAFTLSATEAQKAAHSVVVAAIAGQTVDLDTPDVAITKGFTLLAPPGKPEIVSPITTNLVARVKAGQTLSQAEAAVKTDFGLPNIDLYKNYISAKATDANYQQLHNLAAAMVEVAKNVESSDTNLTLSQKLSLVSASVSTEVNGRLAAIKAASTTAAARTIVTDSVSVGTLQLYASAAKLTALVDLTTNTVTLSWIDSFPTGTRYDIKAQNTDGSFTTVESVSGAGASNSTLTWSRALTASTTYQITANVASTSLILQTPQKQTTVSGSIPGSAPEIAVNAIEPISGSAQLSIRDGFTYPSVSWYSDLRLIGTATTGAGNPVTWNTSTETNSTHLIVARIQVATDSFTEVRRTISVANSNLALTGSVSGTTGTINIDVNATSQYGIARVEAAFDSAPLPSLTEPNAGSRMSSSNNLYRFSVNAATAGSGSHSMVITAIDKQGARKSITVSVPISNMPIITLTSPADGALVNGSLVLTGTSSSDKAGAVTTTASLGDYQFLNTTNANFTGTMSLSSLPAGSYTLTVKATDSSKTVTILQRTVSVTSSSTLAYKPNFTLGVGGQLVKVDESNPSLVLYKADDDSYRVRNTAANTEVILEGANAIAYRYNWAMDKGYVFLEGGFLGSKTAGFEDCPVECIYMWSPSGTKTNLSSANPYTGIYEQYPKAHGGEVIWINYSGSNPGTFTRYNVASKTYSKISQPTGANYLINTEYDFFVDSSGNIGFFFGAQTGGEGVASTFDIYRWSSTTNTSTKLSIAGSRSIYPKTDGQRVIWQQTTPGNTSGPYTLLSQAVTGGATTTLTSNAGSFLMGDGVAAWTETVTSTSTGRLGGTTTTVSGVKASTSNNQIYDVSTLSGVNLYAVSGGNVIFGEAGKVYSWNSTTRQSKLLLETAPTQIISAGKTVYFVMGTTQVLYKILID